MINLPVLVLNQNFEPLQFSRARRALALLVKSKAEVLEEGPEVIHTSNLTLPLPSVVRLFTLVHRPFHPRRLSRQEVFIRDNFTCQYCGRQTRELTLDHVLPRHQGGLHQWQNVVSACIPCNRRKAGRSPAEAGMRLLRQPRQPKYEVSYFLRRLGQRRNGWEKFLAGLQAAELGSSGRAEIPQR